MHWDGGERPPDEPADRRSPSWHPTYACVSCAAVNPRVAVNPCVAGQTTRQITQALLG
ncbi:hypothetical protein [Streptomyces sp. NPDC020917]|uniref:hypothetical protein n=1 Tax=Streptomyces sp. NPDC020917 TaxID=3365102 RepID=UPI0037B1661F